jgi:hypothetical protein
MSAYRPLLSLSSPNFPWPRHIGIKHLKEVVLQDDLLVEQWVVKAGTTVKVWQGKNFGFCLVPKDAVPCGIKRLFSY